MPAEPNSEPDEQIVFSTEDQVWLDGHRTQIAHLCQAQRIGWASILFLGMLWGAGALWQFPHAMRLGAAWMTYDIF